MKYSEPLPNGYTLELHGGCLKPRITKDGEFLVGLSTSLKYYYGKTCRGFVTPESRTQQECIILARKWASEQLINRGCL